MTLTLIAIFIASFGRVFLRAFQQKNVMHDEFVWVLPTSYAMAVAEYFSIGLVAVSYVETKDITMAILAINSLGLGGGIGCLLSMLAHNKLKHYATTKVNQS